MLSVHGIYENGKITIKQPAFGSIPVLSGVIITFTDSASNQSGTDQNLDISSQPERLPNKNFEKESNGYESLRKYKRIPSRKEITIIDGKDRFTFSLFDYSKGGLSFIASKKFAVGKNISSGITDPSNPDIVLMELRLEVRSVSEFEGGVKVGCMFLDPFDEDLWHGLLQYLS